MGRADHPRSRGVYDQNRQILIDGDGLSPLARGLLEVTMGMDDESRIIPARAGFTDTQPTLKVRQKDHPRSRGVYRC